MDQREQFLTLLKQNKELMDVLNEIEKFKLPNYYVAAGSVFQTVWNAQDGKDLMNGVHDIDLVYYDSTLSVEASLSQDKKLEQLLAERFSYEFDVHNEAYMHLWHGRNIEPYVSTENAIERWIATVHAIGISGTSEQLKFFAPFGLNDIFTKTIRPIYHKDNNQTLYDNKAKKWKARFDGLKVISWNEN